MWHIYLSHSSVPPPAPPLCAIFFLMVSQSPLLRFITWPDYKGKWNQLQYIINRRAPLRFICSICNNMIYSNCFHAWLKTHTDNKNAIWMWWRCTGWGWVWDWWQGNWKGKKKKKERGERGETERKKSFGRGSDGLKRVLAFPLEEVLMPYWMQLLMNRCAVCGHCDPGSSSCMATHPIEVHRSRAGEGRHQPPSGLRWRDSRTAGPSPLTNREGGRKGWVQTIHPKTTAPECKQPWIKMDFAGK